MKNNIYKLKSTGFTLIELMTVIILMTVIALIVTPIIVNHINNSKDELYKIQLDNIEAAAHTYMVKRTLDGEFKIIYLRELKKEGLIDKDLMNPKTDNLFSDCLQVKVTKNGSIYQYEILEDIPSTCNKKTKD